VKMIFTLGTGAGGAWDCIIGLRSSASASVRARYDARFSRKSASFYRITCSVAMFHF